MHWKIRRRLDAQLDDSNKFPFDTKGDISIFIQSNCEDGAIFLYLTLIFKFQHARNETICFLLTRSLCSSINIGLLDYYKMQHINPSLFVSNIYEIENLYMNRNILMLIVVVVDKPVSV
ncbi:hypothetical protein Tsp_10806 [Trichinella spiralis]|uniref:hypothetical protein n=1 Tax=Trichinella spiralis TaxID=6334 RepID=UPI0001EFE3BF|nr:hypothetical protein Tsp_10806 [Trichinella spiralis]